MNSYDNTAGQFDTQIITDNTNKACTCTALSIFFILLFVLSPLHKYFFISLFMKIATLFLLAYTIYLNAQQTIYLRNKNLETQKEELSKHLNTNIICSHILTLFVFLLFLFVVKSIF